MFASTTHYGILGWHRMDGYMQVLKEPTAPFSLFYLLNPTGYVMHQQFNLLKSTGYVKHQQFNLLKPTGYVMHQQFNLLKPTG